ncbi:hypothetical protein BDY24DRAFT_372384, partial [Mrakia frigida]|uniref:uncharacterized protein n=1 Tax=Mrakia frigida TaxID=29902 RepID=UPI003FCC057F
MSLPPSLRPISRWEFHWDTRIFLRHAPFDPTYSRSLSFSPRILRPLHLPAFQSLLKPGNLHAACLLHCRSLSAPYQKAIEPTFTSFSFVVRRIQTLELCFMVLFCEKGCDRFELASPQALSNHNRRHHQRIAKLKKPTMTVARDPSTHLFHCPRPHPSHNPYTTLDPRTLQKHFETCPYSSRLHPLFPFFEPPSTPAASTCLGGSPSESDDSEDQGVVIAEEVDNSEENREEDEEENEEEEEEENEEENEEEFGCRPEESDQSLNQSDAGMRQGHFSDEEEEEDAGRRSTLGSGSEDEEEGWEGDAMDGRRDPGGDNSALSFSNPAGRLGTREETGGGMGLVGSVRAMDGPGMSFS